MCESTDSRCTTTATARGTRLMVSGVSRFLLPTFLCGRQRKVGAPRTGGSLIDHKEHKERPTPKEHTKPQPTGTPPLLNPKNPPSKPLSISMRNRISRHTRPGIPLPRAPLKHTFHKLRNRIRITAIAFGDSPKGRPDFSGIDGMTSAASLLAGRARVSGIRSISGRSRSRSTKGTSTKSPSSHTHKNPKDPNPFHNHTPDKKNKRTKNKKPHRTKPPAGQKAKRSIQQHGTTKTQTAHRGGQGLAGAPITGLPNNGVDNAYAPFSVKAQMILRSYSV